MKSVDVAKRPTLQCPEPKMLRRFVDDDLPSDSATLIENHLTLCRECQEIVRGLLDEQRSRTVERLLRDRAGSLLAEQIADASVSPPSGDTRDSLHTTPDVEGYQLLVELGRGAYGVVYRAYDPTLDRDVAIKVPHDEIVLRAGGTDVYLSEARAAARLEHPHIVHVYEATSRTDGSCYIVSQFINGQSLAELLAQRRPDHSDAISLLIPLLDALQHSHERGIVHRDVKPANILIDSTGTPYLTDFGLALRENEVGSGPRYLGTPAYMSPEQARGEGHLVDGRTDIFSVGVILFRMLTGKRPFQAKSPKRLIEMVAGVDAPSARQKDRKIPAELDRICAKALARDVSQRYRCASDMADDLRDFLCVLSEESTHNATTQTNAVDHLSRRRFISLVTLGSASSAVFLGASVRTSTRLFRIGIKPWVGFSPLVVAHQMHLCDNLELAFVPVRNTTEVRSKILAREIEAAPYLIDSHAIARANRTPTKAVLLLDVSLEADAMVTSHRIRAFDDLRGKRVAYMHHEAPHFLLLSLCELHSIDVDDFHHVKVETAKEAAELFVAGEVDAVVTYEPFVQLALSRKNSRRLVSAADDPGSIIDILTVREDVLARQHLDVNRLIRGWFKAVDLLRRNHVEAIEIACKFLGGEHGPIRPSEYQAMAGGMTYGTAADNHAFFRRGESGVNEFQCRVQAAQQRWHRHHQLPRMIDPADGDGSAAFGKLYSNLIGT